MTNIYDGDIKICYVRGIVADYIYFSRMERPKEKNAVDLRSSGMVELIDGVYNIHNMRDIIVINFISGLDWQLVKVVK